MLHARVDFDHCAPFGSVSVSSELVQSDLLSMISTAECAKTLGLCVCMMVIAIQPCGHSIHSVSLALAVRGHSDFLFCLNYCFSFGLYRIRRSSA